MNETLSICILSTNRAPYLLQCLEAFLPQVSKHGIPIYVSYNDSTNTYLEMLTKFKRDRYPNLFFTTDPALKGFDNNLIKVVGMASSRYVWIFGDDDLPRPGAIDTILGHIDKGFSLIIANASTLSYDLKIRVEEKRLRMSEDRVYTPGELGQLVADTAGYATFLGGLIFDRALWTQIDPKPYIGTDYSHVAICYRLAAGRKALVIARPQLDIRLGITTWSHRYFEVELLHWPSVVWGIPDCGAEFKSQVCDEKPVNSMRRLLATRAYRHYNNDLYARFLADNPDVSAWRRPVLRFIAWIPESWLNFLFKAYVLSGRLFFPDWRTLSLFHLAGNAERFDRLSRFTFARRPSLETVVAEALS